MFALLLTGCTSPALRSQSPEENNTVVDTHTKLIGDFARPFGENYIEVKNVALVTNLPPGMGEDPAPSTERAMLVREMQARSVSSPNQLLASGRVAMVWVRGFIPPGAQKGDRFDLEVQIPARSETTSLRGGYLMETRLAEMAVINNEVHDGHVLGRGEGPVLVDPAPAKGTEKGQVIKGQVLGGGAVLKPRTLGLTISPDSKSVLISSQIGNAINSRFSDFVHGTKKGVATPKTDEFIELRMHPRYKDNIARYMRVVAAIPLKNPTSEQQQRLELLERQLLDHITAASAAVKLEAIGKPAISTLHRGLDSSEAEIRFYAAESLAYLDQPEAARPLAQIAKDESAFRVYALAALSGMQDVGAYEELRNLLDVPSAETRYGAFRAIWASRPNDPSVRGENLGGQFSYHIVPTSGIPMVHVTRTFRPEIVLFGEDQILQTPVLLDAGKSIIVKSDEDGQIVVSKFAVGQTDQKRVVSTRVDEVIRAIVELDGSYPDVVQALQQAKTSHALSSRLEVDAIPDSDRVYEREEGEVIPASHVEVGNPVPDLFNKKLHAAR
jgi:hypothetical protein